MSTEIGSLGAAGAYQTRKRTYQGGGQLVDEYVVSTANESTFLSGYAIGTSIEDGLKLQKIDVQRQKGISRCSLLYAPSPIGLKFATPGAERSDVDASTVSKSIYSHPNCLNPNGGLDGEPPRFTAAVGTGTIEFSDAEDYLIPSATYTFTKVVSDFSFTESNALDGIGERSKPEGLTSTTPKAWLKTSRTISTEGELYTITDTWQHAGVVAGTTRIWPDEIYAGTG